HTGGWHRYLDVRRCRRTHRDVHGRPRLWDAPGQWYLRSRDVHTCGNQELLLQGPRRYDRDDRGGALNKRERGARSGQRVLADPLPSAVLSSDDDAARDNPGGRSLGVGLQRERHPAGRLALRPPKEWRRRTELVLQQPAPDAVERDGD